MASNLFFIVNVHCRLYAYLGKIDQESLPTHQPFLGRNYVCVITFWPCEIQKNERCEMKLEKIQLVKNQLQ